MSSAPSPDRPGSERISDLPPDAVVGRLLDALFDRKQHPQLRDDLTELGNAWSPHELGEVYMAIKSMLTEDGGAQFAAFAPMWSPLTNGPGAEYSRETLFDGTVLYCSTVKASVRPALVCFTSRVNGMFMPNCRFLELLGRHPVDIVINSTESGTFGLWNLAGAGSFAGSLRALKAVLAARDIRPGAYAGASAGGGPAVYAAMLDPGSAAVLFGCRFYVPGRNIPLADAGTAFEPICACWTGPKPQVHNIFGALQPVDLENDQRLQALVPGAQSVPLAGDNTHSPMVTLTARRKLRPVLDLLVQAALGAPVNFAKVITP